jgi:hypothetical protein
MEAYRLQNEKSHAQVERKEMYISTFGVFLQYSGFKLARQALY